MIPRLRKKTKKDKETSSRMLEGASMFSTLTTSKDEIDEQLKKIQPAKPEKKIINKTSQLASITLHNDMNARRLMNLADDSKPHPFLITDDLKLYQVDDPSRDEVILIGNAQNLIRSLKSEDTGTPNRRSYDLDTILVSRNVLDSFIKTRVEGEKILASDDKSKRCESLLKKAILIEATDIHIETVEENCLVRYRVNGVILDNDEYIESFDKQVGDAIISSFWQTYAKDGLSGDIAKDGRFVYEHNGEEWLCRISTGESKSIGVSSTAIRLRNMRDVPTIEQLGYSERQLQLMKESLVRAGLVLVCGSVNSGKSTFQVGMMNLRPKNAKNLELSDQIEVILPHFVHLQKPYRGGDDFIEKQLPILYKLPTRHDINFIAINEIRDRETAALMEDLMQLGTPGITSIHAKGWPEAINRLKGAKMQVSTDALFGEGFFNSIAYQTLGRILCDCKLESHPDQQLDIYYKERLGAEGLRFTNPSGCENCRNTGVKGLTAIAEFIPINHENRHYLKETTNTQSMRDWMFANNVPTIHQHALSKIKQGLIDPEQISKALGDFGKHNIGEDYLL